MMVVASGSSSKRSRLQQCTDLASGYGTKQSTTLFHYWECRVVAALQNINQGPYVFHRAKENDIGPHDLTSDQPYVFEER